MLMFKRRVKERVVAVFPASDDARTLTIKVPAISGPVRLVVTLDAAPVKEVKIGFDASRSVAVDREEIYDARVVPTPAETRASFQAALAKGVG